jgi:hypothetical protein
MRKALSGLSVVELGQGISPAYCGKLFADLGADVVKVESPAGDEVRRRDRAASGGRAFVRDGLVLHLHTNKRSAALDPASAQIAGRCGPWSSGPIWSSSRAIGAAWPIGACAGMACMPAIPA